MVRRLCRSEDFAKRASTDVKEDMAPLGRNHYSSLEDQQACNASALPLEYLAARGGRRGGSWGLRRLGVKTDGDSQIDEALAAYCRLRVFDASSARAISYPVELSCPALLVSSFPSNHRPRFFLLMLALLDRSCSLFPTVHRPFPELTCGRNHRRR